MKQSLFKIALPLLALPRATKRFVVFSVDLMLCVLTVWLAFYLRLGEFFVISGSTLLVLGVSICFALPVFIGSGLYRPIFRYSGWPALLAVGSAVGTYGLLFGLIFTVIGVAGVPRTVGIIQPLLLLLFVGSSRALAQAWLGDLDLSILKHVYRPKVLIYGAGAAGRQLAAAITSSREMQVAGFIDDDDRLHGQVLNGHPIFNPVDLSNLLVTLNINDVLLAIPSLSRRRRHEIISQIRMTQVGVRALPSLTDLAQGKVTISDLRELDIEDLLGREPVAPNPVLLAKNIVGKVVLVTGAGGSIGSELCRQILAEAPEKLLLIEQSEFALYNIHQELCEKVFLRETVLIPLLASVQDYDRMHLIMSTWRPHSVYHAAAYKHVPLVEHNPVAGIKNNLLGTLRTAQVAEKNGVSDFVLVSTDKAVRPTNVMGASKRLAELALQALAAKETNTKFSMVRFGNVLASSGSVVPRFRQQIRDGGPVTLTHLDVTRYFMTIPEAAQLVIQAGAMAKGGDVFVLDMGHPVKILDLAQRMIELSGFRVKDERRPDGDIEIVVTGMRPGEKLYEELLTGNNPQPTQHPRILKANEEFIPWVQFEIRLNELEAALSVNDLQMTRQILQEVVEGYFPSNEIVDWIHLEQK